LFTFRVRLQLGRAAGSSVCDDINAMLHSIN